MKRFKRWRLKRNYMKSVLLLEQVDKAMIALNLPRYLRKQLWRDFHKSPARRMDLFDTIKDAMK